MLGGERSLFKIKQSIRFGHWLDSNSVVEGKLLGSYFVKERKPLFSLTSPTTWQYRIGEFCSSEVPNFLIGLGKAAPVAIFTS